MSINKFILSVTLGIFAIMPGQASILVAEYQFQDTSNLGLDSTANANNVTAVGTVTQGTGPVSGWSSAEFDGSSVLERLSALSGYDSAAGFTFSAWVELSDAADYNGIVSQDTGGCCFTRLLTNPAGGSGGGVVPFVDITQHQDHFLGSTLPMDQWFMLTLAAGDEAGNGGNAVAHVYVNGVEVTGSPLALAYALSGGSLNTYIGAGSGGTSFFLNGALSDVRIYQGELTSSDVSTLFDSAGLTSTPEPSAILLVVTGMVGMLLRRRS
jgi:hypothetical protein